MHGRRGKSDRHVMNAGTKACIFCVLSILPGCVTAEYRASGSELSGSSPVHVRIHFAGTDNRYPFVDVTIQDHVFKLMLDIADFSAISLNSGAMDSLRTAAKGPPMTYRDLDGRVYSARRFSIPELELDSLRLLNVPGMENKAGPSDFDGTIGRAFLENFNLLIDYSHGEIQLFDRAARPEYLEQSQWRSSPLDENGRLKIRFGFLGNEYDIGIDTGNNVTHIVKDSPLGRDMIHALGYGGFTRITNRRTGGEVLQCRIDNARICGHEIGAMTVVMAAGRPYAGNGYPGFDFFRNNLVFIDFQALRIWMKRA
jgi:hypothetical protein